MKLYLFALRDSKIAAFGNPMFFQAEGQCIRAVSDEVNGVRRESEESVLRQHPEDFELFSLGVFDSDTGIIESVVKPVIACGSLKTGGLKAVS